MLNLALHLVAIQIVALLLLRPLTLWYFKINRALSLLASIELSLRQMNGRGIRASVARRAS